MQYVAFLRGINVGGHHKVPMAELKDLMNKWGYKNVITLLNSGNIIFESDSKEIKKLAIQLEKHFGFPIPCLIRTAKEIALLYEREPFKGIELTKEKRLYLSFLEKESKEELKLPWQSEDGSFQILNIAQNTIISVLDLSIGKTPKAMEILEKTYGKNITTRNWNTLERIKAKLE